MGLRPNVMGFFPNGEWRHLLLLRQTPISVVRMLLTKLMRGFIRLGF